MFYVLISKLTGQVERITEVSPSEILTDYTVWETSLLKPGDEIGNLIYVTFRENDIEKYAISSIKVGLSEQEVIKKLKVRDSEIEELKKENVLLKAQNNALIDRADFHEDLIADMAMLIYQ